MGAGQQQQPDIEGVAEVQPVVGRRNHRRHTQVHQGGSGLFTRGADTEIAPGDDHIAALHAASELWPHALQAVRRNALDAELHVGAGRQHIGVDVGAKSPDPVPLRFAHRPAHGLTPAVSRTAAKARGSLMRPVMAEAATV